ncbi:hypothetical protein, partial [Desulfococcus multivorans]
NRVGRGPHPPGTSIRPSHESRKLNWDLFRDLLDLLRTVCIFEVNPFKIDGGRTMRRPYQRQ